MEIFIGKLVNLIPQIDGIICTMFCLLLIQNYLSSKVFQKILKLKNAKQIIP